MQGSIQKKGSIYYAVIPLNGKRKWFKGGATKKEAQNVLGEKLSEIQNNIYKELPKVTFKEFGELWLENYVNNNLKPSTARRYQDIIRQHFNVSFGEYKLSAITTGLLQGYVAQRNKLVSAKTVCNEIVVMKRMFKHAYRWGYVKYDSALIVDRPKLTKSEIDILQPNEVQLFLQNTEGHYRVAFLTAVLTGVRAGELWGLQWGDIDWNSKQIHVRRSLWKGKFQTPKTSYAIRKLDIPETLIQELKQWKLPCPVSEYDLMFPSPEGKPTIHDNVIKRYFNTALRKAGLRQVSFHSLRHSNASIRIQSGQNIKYLSTQLGHSSIKITLDIYGHLFNDANFNRQQVELLEGVFQDNYDAVRESDSGV